MTKQLLTNVLGEAYPQAVQEAYRSGRLGQLLPVPRKDDPLPQVWGASGKGVGAVAMQCCFPTPLAPPPVRMPVPESAALSPTTEQTMT